MKRKTINTANVTNISAFLSELEEVCKKYGLSLSHEDVHGSFVVEKYNVNLADWLKQACMGNTLRG